MFVCLLDCTEVCNINTRKYKDIYLIHQYHSLLGIMNVSVTCSNLGCQSQAIRPNSVPHRKPRDVAIFLAFSLAQSRPFSVVCARFGDLPRENLGRQPCSIEDVHVRVLLCPLSVSRVFIYFLYCYSLGTSGMNIHGPHFIEHLMVPMTSKLFRFQAFVEGRGEGLRVEIFNEGIVL